MVGIFAFLFNCTPVGRTSNFVCMRLVIVVFPDHTHLLFFRLYDGSDTLAVCRAHGGYLLDFFCSGIQGVFFTVESLSLLYLFVIS